MHTYIYIERDKKKKRIEREMLDLFVYNSISERANKIFQKRLVKMTIKAYAQQTFCKGSTFPSVSLAAMLDSS